MSVIKKVFLAVCIAVVTAAQTALPVSAYTNRLSQVFEVSAQAHGGDMFSGLSFGDSDWTALCHIRMHGADGAEEYLDTVEDAAEELMKSEGFVRPTELQRAAIILAAAGRCDEQLINAAVYMNEDLSRQGFNAYIWALIAANCADIDEPAAAVNTRQSLAEYIVSKQLPDGGFALRGTAADTDITAAAIYSLAPLDEWEWVQTSLDSAEQCLSELQLENGGYMTIGVENCESSAQAVMAFAALGYGTDDPRVAAAYDAMERYFRTDGYAHLPDGDVSGVATGQAVQALTSLALMEKGERLYDAVKLSEFPEPSDGAASEPVKEVTSDMQNESIEEQEDDKTDVAINGGQIKLILTVVLASCGAAAMVVFFVRGRKNRSVLILGVVLVIAAAGVQLLDIRTPDEYYSERSEQQELIVTLSAECGTALDNMDKIDQAINPQDVIPDDGMVIYPCEVALADGSTALDALIAAAREDRIQVDYSGTSYGVYISGIGHVYEFGFGAMSGWLYRVNGEYPQMSCGAYDLKNGDVVEFVYTCELGDRDFDA